MTVQQGGTGRWVSALFVLILLIPTGIAHASLNWLGDWENHAFGLTVAQRILWGVWVIVAVATFLTHATIFGWSFRRYFRWDKHASPSTPPPPRRPATAPWYKSPAESFSFTVVLVSLTGVVVIATVVLWILKDLMGAWVFWLVCMIMWNSWWVLVIATVLTRITIFGLQKKTVIAVANQPQPPSTGPEPTTESNL